MTVATLAGCGSAPASTDAPVAAVASGAEAVAPAQGNASQVEIPRPDAATPAAGAAPAELDPAASRVDFAAMAGTWRVVGVEVGGGVQALAHNDPAYMGKELTISAEKLAWTSQGGATGGATLSDVCADPVTARLPEAGRAAMVAEMGTQLRALGARDPDPHAVECGTGGWGPEAAGGAVVYPINADTFAMSWYDGATLRLARIKR